MTDSYTLLLLILSHIITSGDIASDNKLIHSRCMIVQPYSWLLVIIVHRPSPGDPGIGSRIVRNGFNKHHMREKTGHYWFYAPGISSKMSGI